ncbi:MAG: hypothetical protein ACYCY6_01735 [Minisyncoccota bacterium]
MKHMNTITRLIMRRVEITTPELIAIYLMLIMEIPYTHTSVGKAITESKLMLALLMLMVLPFGVVNNTMTLTARATKHATNIQYSPCIIVSPLLV